MELVEDGQGGGALALVRNLGRDAEVALADGGDGFGPAGAVAGRRRPGRVQQQVGDAPGGGDDRDPRGWLGLDDGGGLADAAASPTEVPPNFRTITANSFRAVSRQLSAVSRRSTGSRISRPSWSAVAPCLISIGRFGHPRSIGRQ